MTMMSQEQRRRIDTLYLQTSSETNTQNDIHFYTDNAHSHPHNDTPVLASANRVWDE